MSKELFVSSTPHETKVALVENDLLSEIYFERENEYTLAGSIYKGRVTRVLPGMQSAFVDIGLERDAFLYVSDFFEMEDEDETFEPIPTAAKPYEVKPSEPRPEPIQLSRPEPRAAAPAFEGGFSDEHVAPGNGRPGGSAEAKQDGQEGESRRFRGRRRRRGGRDRGFPDNKFASSENGASAATEGTATDEDAGDEAPPEKHFVSPTSAPIAAGPAPVAPPQYKPIILPGESIAKFNRKPEAAPEEFHASESAEAPISERPREDRHREDRHRDDRHRDDRHRDDRHRDDRPRRVEREPEPDRPYAPILLPGESISKYRNAPPKSAPAPHSPQTLSIQRDTAFTETLQQDELRHEPDFAQGPHGAQEQAPHEAHEAVTSPEAMGDIRRETDEQHPWSPAQLRAEATHEVPPAVQVEEIEEVEEIHFTPVAESPRYEAPTHHRVSHDEQAHQASAPSEESAPHFGGVEAEEEVSEEHLEETQDVSSHRPSGIEAMASEPQHEATDDEEVIDHHSTRHDREEDNSPREMPNYQHAAAGSFEEEEFDSEEEDDLPHPAEAIYEGEEYEELEEETLEPMQKAAIQLVQAMNETGAIQEIQGGYEGDDEESEELDEIERAAYAEIGEPETASAELRGPSGTAGLQQRSPQRPGYDRQRGRRGGRRTGRSGGGPPRRESMQRQNVMISDLLKEGQEVLVQIAKEPIGKKGARITSHIALPGRYLVYMPTVNHIGVSRKINSDEERMRLKRIVASERENGHGGFIVRTAAANISEEDLRNDIRFLKSLWHDIRTREESSKSPALIYHDLNLVERIMRDLVTQDFSAIWSDTEQEYERINRFMSRFQPGLVRRVKLYTKETPLFEQFGIDAEIDKALKSKVWLKSGGYIVINQTEALVAIDINTGKYVGKTSRLEDTIVKTNTDAIKEIVRQIRLRDLGGIIVIDFIDMDERRNRQKVMQALEEEMKTDRAPSKVLQFNDFGLVAITRKRVKQSLERTLGSPCPYCTGDGYVKSPSTVCNEIYVEMRKMAKQFDRDILLRVNPEVAKALKAGNGKWLTEMEELTGQHILIKPDATLHQEQFDM